VALIALFFCSTFVVLDAYSVVAFPSSPVTLPSPDASARGYFISGPEARSSSSLTPFVVVPFIFSV
jgi:hypothetical protein